MGCARVMKLTLTVVWDIVGELVLNRALLFDFRNIGEDLLELLWRNVLKIEGFH